jgi:hypothetical protein
MEQDNTIFSPSIDPRFYPVVLLLIVILTMGIRLSAINRTVRWDEGRNLQQYAQRPLSEFLFDFSDTNNHFMNTLMLHIQYRLLGNDEDWKIRVHVFVIGVLVTIATYYAGKELYDADVGLMASALSSVIYMLVEFSINARGYIIITLIYLLMIILINRLKTQTNRRGWIAISVLSALGFFVSPAFLYSMGTLGVWMLLSILFENKGQHRRRVFIYFVGSMILGGILTLLYYIPVLYFTYRTSTEFNDSYIYRLAQPLTGRDFFTGVVPEVAGEMFELVHTGMTQPLIVMSVLGLLSAIIFHYKIGKNRVPLFAAIILWLTIQLSVQQTYIIERTFTFLMPVYVILIAAGWIALVRVVTLRRIPRILIAIIMSVVMVIPIGYQLVSRELLFNAWLTASMPYGREVVDVLPDFIESVEPDKIFLLKERYVRVLNYYFSRDGIHVSMKGINRRDDLFFEDWEVGESRYLIDGHYTRFSTLMKSHLIELPDPNFVIEPLMELSDHYYLYEVKRTPPTLKTITDIEQVELFWFVGEQGVSYEIDDDQNLIFDMYGDRWKILRYPQGDYWQDYRLSTRIKITETSYDFEELLINFRDNGESHYSLGLKASDDSSDGFIGLRVDVNGTFLGYFSTAIVDLELNRWYDIAIDIEENIFTVFIDGEQVLQGNDLLLTKGSIGFLSSPDAKVQLSDIRLD